MDSAIVVGAGSFGASLAWTLAREGVAVTLIDQYEPGDERATSGGETRLIRASHGSDHDYTRMSRRARELWRELEAETGEDLLVECGLAWFARREDGWEGQSQRVLEDLEVPCERMDPHLASRLFPSLGVDDLEFVLYEPEAGALRAARATKALAGQAVAHGAHLIRGRARPVDGAVELEDGKRLDAGAVVWACGAWLPELFGGLVTLRVTAQNLFFYDGGPQWAGVPNWVDYEAAFYGTGDIDALGVKVAPDAEGADCHPDANLPPTEPDNQRAAREYISRRFPSLADAPLKSSRSCRYELSPDSNFVAAQHPAHPETWILGGGSGHGFKHGPALAELVAAAMRGTGTLPERFRLGERQPGRSLRTAGSSG